MQNTIADYFKTQPVLKAWLFGSFARGEEKHSTAVEGLTVDVLLAKCQEIELYRKNKLTLSAINMAFMARKDRNCIG